MQSKIIHIEGLDRTGKDTARRTLVQQSKGNYLVVVRSFLSQVAYARLYNRAINEEYFITQALEAQKQGHVFIYLKADDALISKRIIETMELDIADKDIKAHKEMFLRVLFDFCKRGLFVTIIDTTDQDLNRIYRECEIAILQSEIQTCTNCDLCNFKLNKFDLSLGNGKLVADVKNNNPKYMVVGMNPSSKRYPFNTTPFEVNATGKNGQFRGILKEAGVLDNCVITNLVKCTLSSGDISYKDAFASCIGNITKEIAFYNPEYIIACGNVVKTHLVKNKLFNERKIIEIYHPAYCYSYGRITHNEYKQHILSKLI